MGDGTRLFLGALVDIGDDDLAAAPDGLPAEARDATVVTARDRSSRPGLPAELSALAEGQEEACPPGRA